MATPTETENRPTTARFNSPRYRELLMFLRSPFGKLDYGCRNDTSRSGDGITQGKRYFNGRRLPKRPAAE